MTHLRALSALPCLAAGLVLIAITDALDRRRDQERLDRVFERIREDLESEERDTLEMAYDPRPSIAAVDGNTIRRVSWDGPGLTSFKGGAA